MWTLRSAGGITAGIPDGLAREQMEKKEKAWLQKGKPPGFRGFFLLQIMESPVSDPEWAWQQLRQFRITCKNTEKAI